MNLYHQEYDTLEDPRIASYADTTYYERYVEEPDEDDEPWAVYDPD